MERESMKRQKHKAMDAAPWWGGWLVGVVLFGILSIYAYRAFVEVRASAPGWKTRVHEDFPGMDEAKSLDEGRRRWVVRTANHEPCRCLCGHTLASCLKGDLSCPIYSSNLARVRELIRQSEKISKS